jgi:hypothetical protein
VKVVWIIGSAHSAKQGARESAGFVFWPIPHGFAAIDLPESKAYLMALEFRGDLAGRLAAT